MSSSEYVRVVGVLLIAGCVLNVNGCKPRNAPKPAPPEATTVDTGQQTPPGNRAQTITKNVAQAYIFGFPLVLMDVTREVMTAVPAPTGKKAPINQLSHMREFPDPSFTDVVSPNVDTLYSFAWLDLGKEPMVLSVPAAGKRYYVMQMMDAWTNVFASPGPRTTGNGKGAFAITGPRWQGELPAGVQRIKAPTDLVWIIGRTQTNGKKDYPAVHAFQDQMKLVPLSAWGKPYKPPRDVPVAPNIDETTPPAEQVLKMDTATFFARLNALMQNNPPAAADAHILENFREVGIAPGQPFTLDGKNSDFANAIIEGVRVGTADLLAEAKKNHGQSVNGWDLLPDKVANFGTDYTLRAIVGLVGLGANLPADAIYPHATKDSNGQPLDGSHRYEIRFAKGQLPPVNAFWSLTVYNDKQALVPNPIQRYALGDRDNLKFGADGSLTIYVQREAPDKDKTANWLPTPDGPFNIFMRIYWPKEDALNGQWKMPSIERSQ